MKVKHFLYGSLLLITAILAACTSDSSMGSSEKQQMTEQVKTVEESEFDLIYFNKSYNQYLKALNENVAEEYWTSIQDEIVFGYDAVTYTRDDLAKMSQEEYDNHKEHMLDLIHATGMDQFTVDVNVSEVYEGNQSGQANIYTMENKELKGQPLTATTKKYTLEKRSGRWLITNVDQDKFTYGSEQTADEMNEGIQALKYQTHDGKAIGYPTVFVLSGTGKD